MVKEKNKLLVEYSMINNLNPTSVANWQNTIQRSLPPDYEKSLPTIEEIERELSNEEE